MTAIAVNTQNSAINYTWHPVFTTTGTSVAYTANNAFLFCIRSNATSAMSDTLPDPTVAVSDGSENLTIQNGWNIYISNHDASASITLTPTSPAKINGTTSLTITAGSTVRVFCDGTNYYT